MEPAPPKRNLTCNWTIDPSVTEQMISELSTEMAAMLKEEIDAEILRTMLEQAGWTFVKHTEDDVTKEWVDANLQDKHTKLICGWMFENKSDAEWFILTWC